jgi:glycosyltransferase involved in cell wall biosynthesis
LPKVGLFCTEFLPYSQAFVYEEIRLHTRWRVEVFTKRRLLADRFPFEPVHSAGALYGITRRDHTFDRVLGRGGFDLLHAHFGTGAVYALPFAERHHLPLIVTFHGHDVSRLYSLERFHPETWRYALVWPRLRSKMALGLCASRELLELLVQVGAPRERLRIHRLGVDVDAFRSGKRDPAQIRALMIGRFVEKKGFEYGLRAFAQAAAQRPALSLTIVGDGELGASLRALATELGVANLVDFAGVLPPERIKAELASTDVLLAPSVVDSRGDRESGLIVVKEACASEVVPIGTYHGGIPEIIDDGETGFLVGERDVDALAHRLAELADDPAKRRRMGAAARQKMLTEYDNKNRVEALERHYDEIGGRR